jgi:DNA-binding transcriptional regulator YiaG
MSRKLDPNSLRQRRLAAGVQRFNRITAAHEACARATAAAAASATIATEGWTPRTWLAFTRTVAGASQDVMGKALGVSQDTISRWEKSAVPEERFLEAIHSMVLSALAGDQS